MALTISISQLSQELRITVTGSPAPPILGILTRMLAEAEERIEREAPEAPQATKNRAAIRFIGTFTKRRRSIPAGISAHLSPLLETAVPGMCFPLGVTL